MTNVYKTLTTAACVALLSLTTTPAQAHGAGAFLGGMITSNILGNMAARTRAQEQVAYSQPQTVVVREPSGSSQHSTKSIEARLRQLDKLAADGYITPEEYKARKQQIIDSL